MATAKINVCTDAETKKDVEAILAEMGLNMTSAINIYLKRIQMERAIPFKITAQPNAATIEAIEEGRKIAKDDSVKGYKTAAELREAMGL